jgi:hypothetical protein
LAPVVALSLGAFAMFGSSMVVSVETMHSQISQICEGQDCPQPPSS